MGKTKTPPIRQKRIPGTIDVPTEKVLRKAEDYVFTLQKRMAAQVDENALRAELIEMMKEADLTEFTLDDHTITLTLSATERIVVKKVSNDTDGD